MGATKKGETWQMKSGQGVPAASALPLPSHHCSPASRATASSGARETGLFKVFADYEVERQVETRAITGGPPPGSGEAHPT